MQTRFHVQVVKQLRRGYYASVRHFAFYMCMYPCISSVAQRQVSYMDDELGRVLRALDETGFASNTAVSFFGDHGWQLGELGEWCKHTNFDPC